MKTIITVILIILLILVIVCAFAGFIMFVSVLDNDLEKRKKKKPAREGDNLDDPKSNMYPTFSRLIAFQKPLIEEMKKMQFDELEVTSFDGLKLKGYLLKGNSKEVAILVHGYKSNKENDFSDKIHIYMERGSTVLLVNDRAHGNSEGRYIGFSELDRFDVAKWVDKINEMYENPSIYLHGVSMGGATVIHCADMHLKNVKGIVDDCGFDTISTLTRGIIKGMFHVPYFPIGNFAELFSKMIANVNFNKSNGEENVAHTDIPIVFIHGKEDHFVPCSMTLDLEKACASPHKMLLVEGAGHSAAYMMAIEQYTTLVNELLDGKIQ